MPSSHTYGKKDKLKSRKLIDKIFSEGQVVKAYPFRLHFLLHDEQALSTLQAAVSVSKRHFKKAVDRNRVKRLMREAYRLQNEELKSAAAHSKSNLAMMLIYNSRELPDQQFTSQKIAILLQKVMPYLAGVPKQ